MKTILLATDFSKNAENAIAYALELYGKDSCQFLLLHAFKVDGYDPGSRLVPIPTASRMEAAQATMEDQLREYRRTLFPSLEKSAGDPHPNRVEFRAVNKSLVKAVQEIVRQQKIELLVIGTQGYTGSNEVVYGSNTVNLMEEIQRCPILAVPAHVSFQPLKEVVLANSFKVELTPADLAFLTGVSKKFKAPIRILHIAGEGGLSEEQKNNKDRLETYFRRSKTLHSFHELEHLGVPLGIYAFTQSRDSDWIAFINKKHSLFEKLLLDPMYEDLAHYSKVPVLVLHQP